MKDFFYNIGALPCPELFSIYFCNFPYNTVHTVLIFIVELFSCWMFYLSWVLNYCFWANNFFLLGRGGGGIRNLRDF
jgi:hypothetical protein